jgi:sulfite exporter TauE/SafE
MPDSGLLALFLVGLLGGTHCVGMCGGIVGALSMGGQVRWSLLLSYNGGRIFSYAVAGAAAGALGSASLVLEGQVPIRLALYVLANLMLVALGLYLLGITRVLAPVEGLGQRLWRHVQPLSRRFLPARSAAQAFPLGVLWGWLPCGLVYSALATALTAGSMGRGALAMLAFGLGTLPNLLLAGILLGRFQAFSRRPAVRAVSGLLVLGFGVYGLVGTLRTIGL